MPYTGDLVAAGISTKGIGRPGYCAICSIGETKDQRGITKLYQQGLKAPAINAYLAEHHGKGFDRRTIYNHANHVRHPRDRLVGAVAAREARDGTLPAEVSEDEFLRSVVRAASARLSADPEAVTLDQGMKAAVALSAAKQSRQQGINLLVMTLTRGLDSTPMLLRSGEEEIEGEVVEVTGE